MDGIIVVNKPAGLTSRDVVNEVSRALHTKKVGHTGTLDPMATGVLVLCVNKGLKLCELLTNHDKEYIAGITLGIETDTYDTDSEIKRKCIVDKENNQIIDVVNSFKGTYLQEVPKYSAVKVNGRKLYEYARNNQEVILPKKNVTINSVEIISDIVKNEDGTITFYFKANVSKGTYIRGLIRDIGLKLGVPAVMISLERTRLGSFSINDANELDNIKNNNYKLISLEETLEGMKKIVVDNEKAIKIKNGVVFNKFFNEEMALIYDDNNNLLAIYKNDNDNKSRVYKMF